MRSKEARFKQKQGKIIRHCPNCKSSRIEISEHKEYSEEFEKDFPSLNEQSPNALMYSTTLIKATCLDKSRVLEVIDNGIKNADEFYKKSAELKDSYSQAAHRGSLYALESLKKELGL